MDAYMRENKIESVAPQLTAQVAPAAKAADERAEPGPAADKRPAKSADPAKAKAKGQES